MSGLPSPEKVPAVAAEQAAAWFARRDAGPLGAEEELAFRRWLAADTANARAFARLDRAWADLDTAPVSSPSPERRPRILAVGAIGIALAACVLFVVGLGPQPFVRYAADAASTVGEIRAVTLPDGSAAMLDTASAVDLDFTKGRRVVRLLTGKVAFDVVPDSSRPFTVFAGGGTVTALGTAFSVGLVGDGAIVSVGESRVRVAYPAGNGPGPAGNGPGPAGAGSATGHAEVSRGQRIAYGRDGGLGTALNVDPAQAFAWMRGKLIFEDRPLGEVVAELNRYQVGQILVFGDELARMPVNGVFALRDPAAATRTIAHALGLKIVSVGDWLIVLRR